MAVTLFSYCSHIYPLTHVALARHQHNEMDETVPWPWWKKLFVHIMPLLSMCKEKVWLQRDWLTKCVLSLKWQASNSVTECLLSVYTKRHTSTSKLAIEDSTQPAEATEQIGTCLMRISRRTLQNCFNTQYSCNNHFTFDFDKKHFFNCSHQTNAHVVEVCRSFFFYLYKVKWVLPRHAHKI